MAYTNFTNCTAEEYKNIMYSQETKNKIKILFNNVELQDADEYCESFEVTSRIIPTGSKIFILSNLVSKEATLILHNIDTSIIQDQVSISIGTVVGSTSLGDTYEYVPIGIFNIQEKPTTDKDKTTIKLRDNTVKLDFDYNAKPLIDLHGGSATKKQILDDICSQAGITNNVSTFLGSGDLIGIYDNTIRARQYVSWLAEQAGAVPVITRTGALDFVYLNNLTTNTIPIEIVEKYENGDNFKISRVVYEDAIRKYESGNETYDTLFLDSANPYVSSQSQVDSIKNLVNNFEINSYETGRVLGNPAIDPYDLIQIEDKGKNLWGGFSNQYANTSNTVNFTNNKDGTITASGTANADNTVSTNVSKANQNGWYKTLSAGTYTASATNLKSGVDIQVWDSNAHFYNKTFTLTEETNIIIRIVISNNTQVNTTFGIQLEKSSTVTDYEPYYDNIFTTFANNVLRYNGKLTHTFDSKISLERKTENVTKNSTQTFKNFAKTSIDNLNAEITIQAGKVEEIENELQNPTSTKEGKFIDITDALDKPLIDFKMYGDTQQDSTTQGKNLLDISDITNKTGITNNGTSITLNGTPSSTSWSLSTPLILKANTSYILSSTNTYSGANQSTFILRQGTSNKLTLYFRNSTSSVLTPTEDITIDTLRIYRQDGVTFDNFTFSIQLEKGSSATSFEPFVPNSPSPDYPQPINVVTGDNTIEVVGKNLLENTASSKTENGVTWTVNSNKTIIVSGTASGFTTLLVGTAYVNSSMGNIVISGLADTTNIVWYSMYLYDKDDNVIATIAGSDETEKTNISFDLSTYINAHHISYRVKRKSNVETSGTIKPMIELGNQATTYEPYQSQTYPIYLGVENLYEGSQDFSGTWNNSSYWETDENTYNNLVVKKRAGSWNGINQELEVESGKTYTFSCYIKSDTARQVALYTSGGTSGIDTSKNVNTTTNWERYSLTFTANASGTVKPRIENTSNSDSNYTYICGYQLEVGSKVNSFSPYGTTPIELCKIGEYQDKPFKAVNGDDFYDTLDSATKQTLTYGKWYLHKEIGKVVLNGSENWLRQNTINSGEYYFAKQNLISNVLYDSSNRFIGLSGIGITTNAYRNVEGFDTIYYNSANLSRIYTEATKSMNTTEFQNWLSLNNVIVYYVLATPTNTIIEDTELIEQLETLMSIPLFKGINHITVDSFNLIPDLYIEYFRNTSMNEHFVPNEELGKYYTKVETDAQIKVSSDSIEQDVSRITSNISSTEQTHYQEMLSKMDDKASISDVTNVTNQVIALQTDTYTKTEIQKILNGTDENGNVVQYIQTTAGTFDENGMTYSKTGAPTTSTINQTGLTVNDVNNSSELLFAGYDEQQQQALVRVANLFLTRFLGINNWRIEIINDSTNGEGLAFYYIG